MAESVSIDVLAKVFGERDVAKLGDQFAKTAVTADAAAASLKVWNDTAVKSAKADQTLVTARNAHAKADKLLADAERVLAGEATKTTKLMADQRNKVEDVAKAAEGAAGGFSSLAGTGGLAGGGMGALIGVGVALSPVIATLGVGLAGFGAAAYAVARPIEKAAKASGGLQANLAKLNPEQQQVARGILALGADFAVFQQRMQPEVFGVFNQGLALARTLLHGIEPVAAATGKALGGALAQINAEFASGEWQQFFGFMARTAGPDIQLLTTDFVGLLKVLPPLLENLQPVATTLLKDTSGLLNLVSATEKAALAEHKFTTEAASNTGWLGKLAHAAGDAFNRLVPGASTARTLAGDLAKLGDSSAASGKGLTGTGAAAAAAQPQVFDLNKAVAALNTSMTTLVGNLLALQGGNLSWRSAMQAAEAQLRSNTAGLAGNGKNAIANRQAILGATQAAVQFAQQQLTLHHDISGASATIADQIRWLQGLGSKSSFVKGEIAALRKEEAALNAQRVNQVIHVDASGQWAVVQGASGRLFSGKPKAAGGLIPGAGNADTYPALLTPGEVVVPKGMVGAGAVDHLRGRLPGFAAGGIVPAYSGSVGGVWPWIQRNDATEIRLIDQAVVKATLAGIKAAQAAALSFARGSGGPASGAVRALQQYAASLFHFYGWGGNQLPPLIALWNGESGWNPLARNPSSGAFGIPQALPPGKMGALAASGNAAAQIRWGEGYIHSVYGTPANAYGTWLSRSPHWYDRGGYLPPGLSLAYNGTGRPEMVLPGRGGAATQVVIEVRGNDSETSQFLVRLLKRHVRVAGGGNVQTAFATSR